MSGTSGPGLSISQLPAAATVSTSDLAALTQGSSGPGTGVGRKATLAQILALLPAQPYDIAMFVPGVPTGGQLLAKLSFTRIVTFPLGLPSSQAGCTTAATGPVVLSILQNGNPVGTINYSAGAVAGGFTFSAEVTFNPGDVLTVVGPATADSTFAGPNWTFAATR